MGRGGVTEGLNGGYKLPPKTVVLTFDDGPHNVYFDEIAAILKQYNAPAAFFEVGNNIGGFDKDGKPVLSPRAKVSHRLSDAGFVLANHSFTHAQLAKETGDALKAELGNTDALLKSVDLKRSQLFRFPYGADPRM
jgi:peptidoglycan/xylan/chitin deacetylase (PgdA/CDA1 family)